MGTNNQNITVHINQRKISISDWSELVHCNDDAECRGKFGNTIMQCSELYTGVKNGICAPVFCQNNNECPTVGDICSSGALDGSCDTNTNHCNYESALAIANCIIN